MLDRVTQCTQYYETDVEQEEKQHVSTGGNNSALKARLFPLCVPLLCVCVCTSKFVLVVCMHVCVHACLCYVCEFVCMCVCVCVCALICVHVSLRFVCMSKHVHMCVCTMCLCVCMCVCLCMHSHVCMYVCVRVCGHLHVTACMHQKLFLVNVLWEIINCMIPPSPKGYVPVYADAHAWIHANDHTCTCTSVHKTMYIWVPLYISKTKFVFMSVYKSVIKLVLNKHSNALKQTQTKCS